MRLDDVHLAGADPALTCALHVFGQPSALEVDDAKATARATALIQTYVPRAFLKASSGRELSYAVPKDADRACFTGLFQALEQNLRRLNLTGYGISDATLEEVPRGAFLLLSCSPLLASVTRRGEARGGGGGRCHFCLFPGSGVCQA